MRPIATLAVTVVLTLGSLSPLVAQERAGVMGDLMRDLDDVQTKIVGLAKAMPADAFGWRPAAGVRSTSETLMHVAADNYFMPAMLGVPAPAETGINGKDYKTAVAVEKRTLTREQVIAEVEKSFAFLKSSMSGFPDAKLETTPAGEKATHRRIWVMTITHLHEHLGQLIAYARSNKVTPPWSK